MVDTVGGGGAGAVCEVVLDGDGTVDSEGTVGAEDGDAHTVEDNIGEQDDGEADESASESAFAGGDFAGVAVTKDIEVATVDDEADDEVAGEDSEVDEDVRSDDGDIANESVLVVGGAGMVAETLQTAIPGGEAKKGLVALAHGAGRNRGGGDEGDRAGEREYDS